MPAAPNATRAQFNLGETSTTQLPPPTINHEDVDRQQRHSRSSSAELAPEPLIFVPQRKRNTVSRRDDDTDRWGIDELDSKEEHRLVLRDNTLKNTILSRLNTFRKNRELCDVILFVREREIIGHKVVLAAISSSLFELFKNESEASEETAPNNKENPRASVGPNNAMSYFEFNQGDYDCFEALVEFAYTGVLSISSLKVPDLYKTSFALQVTSVAAACANHLYENLSVNNCIGTRRHANFNNDAFLVDKIDSFIVENFEKIISDSIELTKLPCIKTRIIVPHDGHQIREDKAVGLASRAISYFQNYTKISDRVEQQIEALTQKSHLLFLEVERDTLEDGVKIKSESTLGSSVVVQDYKRSKESKWSKTAGHNSQPLGVEVIKHHVTGALPVKIDASRVANSKYASNESLNSIGSSETDVEQEIESKLIALNQSSPGFWIALAVLYKRLVALSIQMTDDEDLTGSSESTVTTPPHEMLSNNNNNLSMMNGPDAKQPADLTQASVLAKIANCSALARQPIPPMSVARCSVGAAFLNGRIVVCGGYNRGECLKTVEEYGLETGKWQSLPPMTTERGRLGAAVVNGKLYAAGGSDGNNDLASVECYEPKTQTWKLIQPMNKARSNNTCIELGGYLYCIGGSNDQQALRECERFNFETGQWETIAALQVARAQAACTALKGHIVVVGGSNRSGCLDSVEAYDPQTNTWKSLAKMSTPRRGCAVTTCKNILYVMGGNDGTQSLTSCEALENLNAHWRAAPSLINSRGNTTAVTTAGNVIYLLGGFDNINFLSSVEIMESEVLGWRSWLEKNLGRHSSLNEEDEEPKSMRSESATPRASAATISVK